MKRIEGLNLAMEIANILNTAIAEINQLEQGEWCGWWYPWNMNEPRKIHFFEFLIFGSVVKKCDHEKVGDLDMIIIDNGVISPEYQFDCRWDDWYGMLNKNLLTLLSECSDYLHCHEVNKKVVGLIDKIIEDDFEVDLHILPRKLFLNKKYRMEALSRHKDPNFFKNCFDSMLRLRMGKQFVPVNVSYFEYKYKRDLRDLKK